MGLVGQLPGELVLESLSVAVRTQSRRPVKSRYWRSPHRLQPIHIKACELSQLLKQQWAGSPGSVISDEQTLARNGRQPLARGMNAGMIRLSLKIHILD